MQLNDKGFNLIDGDLKRLGKKCRSIQTDLENYYKIHNDSWIRYGAVPGIIASGKNYQIGKQRIGLLVPKLTPSEGARLWFVINTLTGDYYRCLLYLAREEQSYPQRKCFEIVNLQIKSLIPSDK